MQLFQDDEFVIDLLLSLFVHALRFAAPKFDLILHSLACVLLLKDAVVGDRQVFGHLVQFLLSLFNLTFNLPKPEAELYSLGSLHV